MNSLLDIISAIIYLLLLLILLVTILYILLVSSIYFLLWLHDIFFGNALIKPLKRGMKSRIKFINEKSTKIYGVLFPGEICLRYETPLLAFCFSYVTIAIIAFILPIEDFALKTLVSMLIYNVIYLIGMKRKYGNSCRYIEALKANLDFLKLSFIPITFFFTTIGFALTLYSTFSNELHDINVIYSLENQIYYYLTEFTELANRVNDFGFSNLFYVFELLIILCILLYCASIPLQLIGYFFIQVILYFQKYKLPYYRMVKEYLWVIKKNIPKI